MGKRQLRNKVKEFREMKGLSQEDLAKLVRMSRNSISSVERLQYIPSADFAASLCEVLECKFEELFYFDSPLEPGVCGYVVHDLTKEEVFSAFGIN